jgi:hypothetical protein
VDYSSGNPPDNERGGLGPCREDLEQEVDDIFLTNKDRDAKVGDNSVGDLSGVRLVGRRKTGEYNHVGRKGDTEKPSVNGKEQIERISNGLGIPFNHTRFYILLLNLNI